MSSCQKKLVFMSHANIVQRVKTCYKIKIDYRVLVCSFYRVLLRFWPHYIIKASFPLQHSHYWCGREAFLFDYRGCVGVLEWLFSASIVLVWFCHSLHIPFLNRIISCASVCYRCTLKTRKFRTKDFVVR